MVPQAPKAPKAPPACSAIISEPQPSLRPLLALWRFRAVLPSPFSLPRFTPRDSTIKLVRYSFWNPVAVLPDLLAAPILRYEHRCPIR